MSNPRDDGTPAPADLLDRWLTRRGSEGAADDAAERPAHRADGPPLTGPLATTSRSGTPSAVDRDLASPEAAPDDEPATPPTVAPARSLEHSVFAAFQEARAAENPPPEPEPVDEPIDEPVAEPEPEPLSPTAAASPLVAAARNLEHERAAATEIEGAPHDRAEPDVADLYDAPAPSAADTPGARTAPAAVGTRTRAAGAAPTGDGVPARVEFSSSRLGQLTMSLLVLVGILVTAGLGYVAYDSRATTDIALAGVAGVLTLVIWAVRAGSGTTRIVVDRGILRIQRGSSSFSFDLTNVQLDVEETAATGARGWSFVIHRRSLGPVVIDRSMVDPERFMTAVRRYRRDV